MPQPSSLHLKILSLAVVVWGLMSGLSLTLQGATWVPWLALVLLMLLEAYSGDAKPASWSRWSAGLTQLIGPAMLPYYAVLIFSLALGPDLMRGGERGIPHIGPALPKAPTALPTRPNTSAGVTGGVPVPQAGRPLVPGANKFARPNTPQSATPGVPSPAAAPGAPMPTQQKPSSVTPAQANNGAAKASSPQILTPSSSSNTSPTSSAKPPAVSSPAK